MKRPISSCVLWTLHAGVATSSFLFSVSALADEFYVAPDGSDANPGTLAQPFASLARGQQAASAGDTVFLRGGDYLFTNSTDADGVLLNKSGAPNNPIRYWAYQDEVPVLDFSGMTAALRITGLRVTASWVHLKGLEVKLVPQNISDQNESWGIYNTGSNNVYEMLNLHHNMGPGFFLGGGGNNLILNCDSHHNYDPRSRAGDGENADGFGCHTKTGDTGNVFRGIRAWWNTDDGYDSISAQEACLVEDSWAWYNGYLPDTMTEPMRDPDIPPGNGNGFKLGGFGLDGSGSPAVPPKHTIRRSLAFLNVFAGFFANYHTSGHYFYNNTGFGNLGADFDMLGLNEVNTSVLRNNVAYGPNPTKNLNGTDDESNSWNLPVDVSEQDFQSIVITGMDGPRQPDGSLPVLGFMRLQPDSDLIDRGVDLGLPFIGEAPDLGAFENAGPDDVVDTGGTGAGGEAQGLGGTAGSGSGGQGGVVTTAGGGSGGNNDGGAGPNGGFGGSDEGAGGLDAGGSGTGGRPPAVVGTVDPSATAAPVATGPENEPSQGTEPASVPTTTTSEGTPPLDPGPSAASVDSSSAEPTGCGCRVGLAGPSPVSGALAGMWLLSLAACARRRRPRLGRASVVPDVSSRRSNPCPGKDRARSRAS